MSGSPRVSLKEIQFNKQMIDADSEQCVNPDRVKAIPSYPIINTGNPLKESVYDRSSYIFLVF